MNNNQRITKETKELWIRSSTVDIKNEKLSSRDIVNFCVYCFAYCKHYITE